MTEDTLASFTAQYRINLERSYSHPIDRLWSALTNVQEISAWMKYPVTWDGKVGERFLIEFGCDDESIDGLVTEATEGKVFSYTWGDGIVKWEIEEAGEGTRLKFSHSGVPTSYAIGVGAGWHAFIDHLGSHLDGLKVEDNYKVLEELYELKVKPELPV